MAFGVLSWMAILFVLSPDSLFKHLVDCQLHQEGNDSVTNGHVTMGSTFNPGSIEEPTTHGLVPNCEELDTNNNTLHRLNPIGEVTCINGTSQTATVVHKPPTMAYKWALQILKWLHMSGGVVTLVLGIPGNLLACAVLLRPKLRALPGNIFLIFMTFSDFVFILCSQFLTHWLKLVFGFEYLLLDDWICKINTTIKYVSLDFSKCNLVGLTMERFISICFPMKAITLVTQKRRIMYIIGGFIWAIIANFLDFTSRSVILAGSSLKCEFKDAFLAYVKNGFHLTNTVVATFAVMIFNVLIVITLIRQRKTVEQDLASGQKAAKHRNVTRMLLAVSFVFILCTTPACLTLIIRSGGYHTPVQAVVFQYLFFFVYVNHAINVLLYFLSGPLFHKEMVKLFRGICKGKSNENQSTSNESMTRQTSVRVKSVS